MATNVDIIIRTIDQSKPGATSAIGNLAQLAARYVSVGAAAAVVVKGMQMSVKAAEESSRINAKLESVLRATGYAAGMTGAQIGNMATSLSKLSGVDDEVIKNSAAVLATFREIGGEVFPQAMQAALDMSAVMGQDLQSSVVQLGKALNDPIAGVTALRRVGVQLNDQQKEQIASFMKSGDILSAQNVIMKELQMEFGGAAEAMQEAGSGADGLKVAFGNLQEAIGGKALPVVRAFNVELAKELDIIANAIESGDRYGRALDFVAMKYGMTFDQLARARASSADFNAEIEEQISLAMGAQEHITLYNGALGELQQSEEDAAAAAELFNSQMDTLKTILAGDLGKAQDDYNAKIAEYVRQLKEAKTQKEKDEINANIAAETAAYNDRAKAVMFNIQQEAILNSQVPDGAKIGMITALGQAYGLYDDNTAKAITTTQGWIERVEDGSLSVEGAIQYMKDYTRSLEESEDATDGVAGAARAAKEPILHVGERAKDTADGFGIMGESAIALGDDIFDTALPAVGGLKSQLNGMPPTGTGWSYWFDISVNGSVPRGLPGQSPLGGPNDRTVCFVDGTLVTMADGTQKPIEQVQIGDDVRSFDTERGEFVSGTVSQTFQHEATDYLDIDGLLVTPNHPVWVIGRREFIPAEQIQPRDLLLRDNGGFRMAQHIRKVAARVTVYNLEVEGVHNYFAGGVLVHNKVVENWKGGPLNNNGWTIVGDAPGGVIGPYTEAIYNGVVYPAGVTKWLKESGVLDGARKLRIGGDLAGAGVFTGAGSGYSAPTTTTRRASSGTRVGNAASAYSAPTTTTTAAASADIATDTAAVAATVAEQAVNTATMAVAAQQSVTQNLQAQTNTQVNAQQQTSNNQIQELRELQRLIKKQATKDDLYAIFKGVQQTSI
jgi:hypothetical protein